MQYLVAVCLLVGMQQQCYAAPLTLKQAQAVALSQSPEIKSLQASRIALSQQAIAAGQLADPKLIVGAMNVPVDNFNFSQEPMTQIQFGLSQSFPRGHSLRYKTFHEQDLSLEKFYRQRQMRLQILRNVRMSWLNLYYWNHAKRIILKQKKIFIHLVKVTESMLANNKAHQKDVIGAQLELSELDNRLLEVNQKIAIARAALSRWIGQGLAQVANPTRLPRWPSPALASIVHNSIKMHPELRADSELIKANKANVELAKQQFWPGFSVGVVYGVRQGENVDGNKRADFLSTRLSMDLPIFAYNRQDRQLKASEESLVATKENQISDYRQLHEELIRQYAIWKEQGQSVRLFKNDLLPKAKHYAKASLAAYQNAQTDFQSLARAFVTELNTQLNQLQARVNQKLAQVNLLYLQGK